MVNINSKIFATKLSGKILAVQKFGTEVQKL